MGNEQFTRGMWENFILKRAEAQRIRDDAVWEKQEGIQGQWQQESPFGKSWNKPEEMKIWDVAQKSCGKAFSQGQQMGRLQRRMQGKREVI